MNDKIKFSKEEMLNDISILLEWAMEMVSYSDLSETAIYPIYKKYGGEDYDE